MLLIATLFLALFNSSLTATNPLDRYDRNKKPTTHTPAPTETPTTERSFQPDDEVDTTLLDNDFLNSEYSDPSPHTPLGSICIEITEYCNYFVQHCMDGPLLNKQKEALRVFCSVLKLLTNLADTDCAIIRLDSYITNIIDIIESLENASNDDTAIIEHRIEFPLIASLQRPNTENNETRFIIHNALRTPTTATPLIKELFNELKTYSHHKLDAVLQRFKIDTKRLLTMSQNSESSSTMDPLFSPEERKNMESLGWLCRHAAHTCTELTETVQTSPLMAHTGALMDQIQQMLSTMALTYSHLGTNQVRSQDRNSLASLYAHMVENFGTLSPRKSSQSLLSYVSTLPSINQKEVFINSLFASARESELFLGEFYPAMSDSLAYNLDQFCTTLVTQVLETFSKRYWLSQE